MAKRALPEKQPLTSLDDDREIMQVQKEPHKVLQPLEPLAPLRVDMNAVIQNVQNQIQQSQQSYYTDEYISEGFIQHGTQPTSIRMLHPVADANPVNDTNAMQEQDNQRPLEVVNGPVVAPPMTMLAGEFDMSNPAARTLYDQLAQPRDDFKKRLDLITDMPGRGFTVSYNVPSATETNINVYYCDINFKEMRAVVVNDDFREKIMSKYLDKSQINKQYAKLEVADVPLIDLYVYWILDPKLNKEYNTSEYVEYFRKLFFLFAVDKNLEYFLGDQHDTVSSRRVNLTRSHVTWNKIETDFYGIGGFGRTFEKFNYKEGFLSEGTHYPECIIYQVDVGRFTVIMEVDNRRIYFQAVCTENNVYVITNLFNDIPKKKLPRPDEPFSFEYKNKLQEGQFEADARTWREMEFNCAYFDDDTPFKYRVTHKPKGWRRKAAPPKLVYVINFRFDFLFPVALARRNVENDLDDPIFFTDVNHIARSNPAYQFDPIMIFENDWKILHDFIITFLYPSQFLLPTATGSVEDGVDEQHVDQPAEPRAIEPAHQPFGQLAKQAMTSQDIEARVDNVFEQPLIEQLHEQQGKDVPGAVANAQMVLMQSNYEEARRRKEQQVRQPAIRPVMDQLMDHADQYSAQKMPLEDTTSDTECPPERLMELEEEPSEEIGNVSQLPPIYSQ